MIFLKTERLIQRRVEIHLPGNSGHGPGRVFGRHALYINFSRRYGEENSRSIMPPHGIAKTGPGLEKKYQISGVDLWRKKNRKERGKKKRKEERKKEHRGPRVSAGN